MKTTKLYNLKKGSKIYKLEPNGDKDGVIIFDHPDGMYSYCYIEDQPDKVVHLGVTTELKPYKDGWEVA